MSNAQNEKKYISYAEAVKNINLVLCNNISELEPELLFNGEEIGEMYEEYNATDWESFEEYEENRQPIEIYQYFLTDCSQSDCEYYAKSFNLSFGYSEKLDLYVLLVTHYGTAWDSVEIEDKREF